VPAGGLSGVAVRIWDPVTKKESVESGTVTSSGRFALGKAPSTGLTGFFASAGPDGVFELTRDASGKILPDDDNVYSFGN
jgi:hypothetical protein